MSSDPFEARVRSALVAVADQVDPGRSRESEVVEGAARGATAPATTTSRARARVAVAIGGAATLVGALLLVHRQDDVPLTTGATSPAAPAREWAPPVRLLPGALPDGVRVVAATDSSRRVGRSTTWQRADASVAGGRSQLTVSVIGADELDGVRSTPTVRASGTPDPPLTVLQPDGSPGTVPRQVDVRGRVARSTFLTSTGVVDGYQIVWEEGDGTRVAVEGRGVSFEEVVSLARAVSPAMIAEPGLLAALTPPTGFTLARQGGAIPSVGSAQVRFAGGAGEVLVLTFFDGLSLDDARAARSPGTAVEDLDGRPVVRWVAPPGYPGGVPGPAGGAEVWIGTASGSVELTCACTLEQATDITRSLRPAPTDAWQRLPTGGGWTASPLGPLETYLPTGEVVGRLVAVGGPSPGYYVGTTGTVSATDVGSGREWSVATDAQGRWQLDVPEGRYRLRGRSPGYGGGAGTCAPSPDTEVVVEAGHRMPPVDVRCEMM